MNGRGGCEETVSRNKGRCGRRVASIKTMRTSTHGVIGYLLYAKRPRHEQRLAILGSILPDVFLALGFVAHYGAIVTQSALGEALHRLLHHSALHTVTVAMHSFVM